MTSNLRSLAALFMVLLISAPSAHAIDSNLNCQKRKLKIAGRYANCRLKAAAIGVETRQPPNYAECVAKFSKWESVEARSGRKACPTQDDGEATEARITRATALLAKSLTGMRYEDTGHGTVIDHRTGLEWQKTDDAGGLTDKDNLYSWENRSDDAIGVPDGTLFTEFLGGLNAAESASSDGETTTGCYGGHCDWRIPLIEEIATIVDCDAGQPCLDQAVFGPIESEYIHWTLTIDSSQPEKDSVWTVDFWRGQLQQDIRRHGEGFARAVRTHHR